MPQDFYLGRSITPDVRARDHIPGARMPAHVELIDDKTSKTSRKWEMN